MRIAALDCLNRFQLAPMCDVTNWPFRQLCREQGAGLLMTEMISSAELAKARKRTLKLMEFQAAEAPIGVQISACPDIDAMEIAARMAQDHGASLVNLNCGCPVKKVIKGGSGSALLRDLEQLRKSCARLRKVLTVPLTLKVRAGWDGARVNALEVGRLAVDEGIDAIALHARTRAQGYEGNANWALIRELADTVSIPVIGNGDIFTPSDAFRMLEETGCAAVMIGRGAMGNPWIFRGLTRWAQGDRSERWKPTHVELADMIRRHLDRFVEWAGEPLACLRFRKHLLWYCHTLPGARRLRRRLPELTTRAALEPMLDELFAGLDVVREEPVRTADRARADFKPNIGGRCAA